ncbi:UNVERIFIED_CONTAM: putative ABC transporter ATP-binding protein [Trichonephila clavipes]
MSYVARELSQKSKMLFGFGSFLIPILLWCAVSYFPFIWHPQVKITDSGSVTYLQVDSRIAKDIFYTEAQSALDQGNTPPQGVLVNPIYLPAPHEVAIALVTAFTTPPAQANDPWFHESLWHSIKLVFTAFFISSLVGVPLGILCGFSKTISQLTEPFVEFFRYLPAPAFGALAVAILGINDAPKIAIIIIGTLFQQVLIIANTTRLVDRSLIEAGFTLGTNKTKSLIHVVIPAALPEIYRDLRVLLGWAWTYLIVAELIGSTSEAKQLTQSFKHGKTERTVLNQIDLKIHKREFICVIGPSGCGKSTFSRIVAGLDSYSGGEILIDGQPIMGPSPERGMVFQGYTLFPWKTVKENVMFGPKMKGQSDSTAEAQAREWINIIGLEKYENQYPHQLSGGMKQRVAIARALVNEPKILLMDEPFGALDPHTRQKMQRHLMDLWQNIDITIIFVTHDMDEAILLADRIVALKANPGEIKEIIEVDLPRPRHPDQMLCPEFKALRQRVDQLVHADEDQLDPALEDLPLIPRMTKVSDD